MKPLTPKGALSDGGDEPALVSPLALLPPQRWGCSAGGTARRPAGRRGLRAPSGAADYTPCSSPRALPPLV